MGERHKNDHFMREMKIWNMLVLGLCEILFFGFFLSSCYTASVNEKSDTNASTQRDAAEGNLIQN